MRRDTFKRPHTPVLSTADGVPGCGGKRQYPDFAVASKMAERTRRQVEEAMSAYKCRHCHFWHVGGTPDSDKRKGAR